MLATDPLSLVFIGCFVVSGTFLILSSILGFGHGHFFHIGHTGHAGAVGHVGHAGPAAGHASGVIHHALPQGHAAGHSAHVAAHSNASQAQNAAASAQTGSSIWATLAQQPVMPAASSITRCLRATQPATARMSPHTAAPARARTQPPMRRPTHPSGLHWWAI